jgi:hypothetical protein
MIIFILGKNDFHKILTNDIFFWSSNERKYFLSIHKFIIIIKNSKLECIFLNESYKIVIYLCIILL